MKYQKPHKALLYIANPLLIILGVLLYWHFLIKFDVLFFCFISGIALCLLLIFSKYGSYVLSNNHDEKVKRYPFLEWFSRILLLEISMLGMFCAMCWVIGMAFPVMSLPRPALFSDTLFTMMYYGLFPWTTYALITVGMAVIAYRQQLNAFFFQLFLFLNETITRKTIQCCGEHWCV